MRWLVVGANGQLGRDLVATLQTAQEHVVGKTKAELDICDVESVEHAIATERPDITINAAAYTAVDAAETDIDTAYAVNATGPRLLADALRRHGGRLIHVSTDYVFDGTATRPYEPDDPTGPTSVYGASKLAGEQAVRTALPDRSHVVRTAWLWSGRGKDFVSTMRRLAHEQETVDVVDDQTGSPTRSADLAAGLIELGRGEVPPGVLHCVNAGSATWYELARAVFATVGADPERVHRASSADVPRRARRPAWSVLSTVAWTQAGLSQPSRWEKALEAMTC